MQDMQKAPGFEGNRVLRLPNNRKIIARGKEGCARETQEGCPAPLKPPFFRTFWSSEKCFSVTKRHFRHAEAPGFEGNRVLSAKIVNSPIAGRKNGCKDLRQFAIIVSRVSGRQRRSLPAGACLNTEKRVGHGYQKRKKSLDGGPLLRRCRQCHLGQQLSVHADRSE